MSALSDKLEAIEQQRDRLYDGITRIYAVAHAYCQCADESIQATVDAEFEESLKVIDLVVIRTGAFYLPELKRLADKVCAEAERSEKEGVGE